jgi:hypothetical protein
MMGSLSGGLATMGPAVPYAIAAKFAYPDRPVIAMAGDGAMQMNGINELITIAKYRRKWSDPRLVVLVLKNRDLNQVTWEQRAMAGDPKFAGSQDVPDFRYAAYAELLGLKGVLVNDPDEVARAWETRGFRSTTRRPGSGIEPRAQHALSRSLALTACRRGEARRCPSAADRVWVDTRDCFAEREAMTHGSHS